MYCKNCGVELEENMQTCPLCGQLVNEPVSLPTTYGRSQLPRTTMSRPQKKFTWEIISVILLSAAITTFIVNYLVNRNITWSEYTAAIGLTIFCYISFFSFSNQPVVIKMAAGFLVSSAVLFLLDAFTRGISWSLYLAIPVLLAANIVVAVLILIFRSAKYKGVNLIASSFLGAALLCMAIDGILSYFKSGIFQMDWSLIVTACVIPVVIVLLFVHFRLKKGRNLERTFHI